MRDRKRRMARPGPLLDGGTILQSRYRIGRLLGVGGMGVVYDATDLRLNYTVAIKQVMTTDEKLWQQFEREAQLLARLSHPALPRVSDYFTEGNRAFFVMQFVDGADLAEIINKRAGALSPRQVIAWADQLLDALIYLHSQARQIVHRDIKPHNLKVNSAGQVVLLDFGLAKCHPAEIADHHANARSVFGYTPRYAPLEQIRHLETTPRSDIYALGATLYHLLTGIKPPDAVTRATAFVNSHPSPLRPADELNPAVGPALSAILDRAMSQSAGDRYASASEFREALREVGRTYDGQPFDCCPAMVDGIVRPGRPGIRSIAAWIVILLAAFGVFCRYYHWNIPPESGTSRGVLIERPDQPGEEAVPALESRLR